MPCEFRYKAWSTMLTNEKNIDGHLARRDKAQTRSRCTTTCTELAHWSRQ
jgi:hypothetical protein